MILYRPSPAFPEPSTAAMEACYNSAVEILRIHAEMNRFATLVNSWFTAHAVFTRCVGTTSTLVVTRLNSLHCALTRAAVSLCCIASG